MPTDSPDRQNPDASRASDTSSDFHGQSDAGAGDTEVSSDSADAADAEVVLISPPNPEAWLEEAPCTGNGEYVERLTDEPFEVPTVERFKSALNRDDIRRLFGNSLPTTVFGVAASHLYGATGDRPPYDLYVEPGEDLVLSIFVGEQRFDDTYIVTPMLDYQPVEATFQHYSADRENLTNEVQDTGYFFKSEEGFDPIDMTIDADAFTTGRMHEVALAVRGINGGYSYRLQVFYGGYEPPPEPLPCVPEPLEEEWTEFDIPIRSSHMGADVVTIFTVPTTATADRRVHEVAPGETVRIFSTLFRRSTEFGPNAVVLQPTLNGRPVGESWWRSRNGPGPYKDHEHVDARDFFDITFPDEPGKYYIVALKAFESPWDRWRDFGDPDPPNNGFPHVMNKELVEGSNYLRFRVVDPAGETE